MNRYDDRERYFLELAGSSREYFVPYVLEHKEIGNDSRILEIGCGEGGNLLPFAEIGCLVAGLDLAPGKIANAERFFRARGLEGDFFAGNFITSDLFEKIGRFDVVIVHDVIEHIDPEFKATFFERIKDYMLPDAVVFFGFPAWQMPFGGHQQICVGKVCSKIPYAHLLPEGMYRMWLRMFGASESNINELLQIKRSRMTAEKFESICRQTGYSIIDRTLWLINPHYKVKFNLRPRRLWKPIAGVPCLRNFFSTSCFYLIRRQQGLFYAAGKAGHRSVRMKFDGV